MMGKRPLTLSMGAVGQLWVKSIEMTGGQHKVKSLSFLQWEEALNHSGHIAPTT